MYVITCPTCAKETPVSLVSTEGMTCTSCGYTGPASPEAIARLQAAAALVRGLGSRERQLSGVQRKAMQSSGCLTALLVGVLVALMIPALLFAILGVSIISSGDGEVPTMFGISFIVTVCAPVLVLLVFGVGGLLWLKKSRRALRLAAAAEPPAHPGGAARCRMCAADLPGSQDPVVRCQFCESDNLVDRELLGKMSTTRHAALDDYQQVVASKSGAVRKAVVSATLAIVMAVVVGPIAVVVLFIGSALILGNIEASARLDHQYGMIPTPGGQLCAGSVYQHAEGDWIVNFWDAPPPGVEAFTRRPTLDGLNVVDANWFLSRQVSGKNEDDQPVTGTVERVHSTHLGARNYAVVEGQSLEIIGICMLDIQGR